jgi:hypothetical protein
MADEWIKMRVNLGDDPAVISISTDTGLEQDHVVGKLHRLWSWASLHTTDGNAPSVTLLWVDRYIGTVGFAQAVQKTGWLIEVDGHIQIPKFEAHMSQGAKRRALTHKRVVTLRVKKCNAPSVTKALPDKTRLDINRKYIKEKSLRNQIPPSLEAVATYCTSRHNGIDPQHFVDYYDARDWKFKTGQPMKDWQAAIRTWETNKAEREASDGKPIEDFRTEN